MTAIGSTLSNGPPRFMRLFQQLVVTHGDSSALLVGLAMMLVATLGGFTLLLPAIAAWWYKAKRFEAIDLLPFMLCGSFLLLWLIAPVASSGGPSEFKQRHFILLYAIVAAWVISRVVQLCGGLELKTSARRVSALTVFGAMVVTTLTIGRDLHPAAPIALYMSWSRLFYGVQISPGIANVAAYIRQHSRPGDTLMMTGAPINNELMGPLVELVSLSDVPAYLSRTDLLAAKGADTLSIAAKRSVQIDKIVQGKSWHAACETMRANKIRWYVEGDANLPRWDTGRNYSAFGDRGFAAYDAGDATDKARCTMAPE